MSFQKWVMIGHNLQKMINIWSNIGQPWPQSDTAQSGHIAIWFLELAHLIGNQVFGNPVGRTGPDLNIWYLIDKTSKTVTLKYHFYKMTTKSRQLKIEPPLEAATQILMCDKTLWSFYSPLGLHQRVSTNVLFVKYLGPSSFSLLKEKMILFFIGPRVWGNEKRIFQVSTIYF